MKRLNWLLCCLLAAGCHEATLKQEATTKTAPTIQAPPPVEKVPLNRVSVKTVPVAEYKEKTDNPLNDWYFSVTLYETPKTFQYVMKLKYEEMEGNDTLNLPDVGILPKPVIQKGDDKYSCIVGFMDSHDQFREYKKVYVKSNQLKVTALKHYPMASYIK